MVYLVLCTALALFALVKFGVWLYTFFNFTLTLSGLGIIVFVLVGGIVAGLFAAYNE